MLLLFVMVEYSHFSCLLICGCFYVYICSCGIWFRKHIDISVLPSLKVLDLAFRHSHLPVNSSLSNQFHPQDRCNSVVGNPVGVFVFCKDRTYRKGKHLCTIAFMLALANYLCGHTQFFKILFFFSSSFLLKRRH